MSKAVGAIVGGVVGFIVGGPVGAVIGATGGFAAAPIIGQLLKPPGFQMPQIPVTEQQLNYSGVTVNKEGTDHHIPVVYGIRHVGGIRVYLNVTNGSSISTLHVKQVVSEGEIERYNKVYIDDSLYITWTPYSGPFGGLFNPSETIWNANRQGIYSLNATTKFRPYEVQDGFYTNGTIKTRSHQPVSFTAGLFGKDVQTRGFNTGPGWTDNHTLPGLAFSSIIYRWWKAQRQEDVAANPFRGVPTLTFELYGKRLTRCENLRFYNTNTTSDSRLQPSGEYYQSVNGRNGFNPQDFLETIKVFDRNPVNVLFDYLTNKRYGKGLPLSEIDLVSFRDEAFRWYRDANGNLLPEELRQHCDAVIDTGKSVFDNVNEMLFNMNAALPYINGRFTLKVESNRNETGQYGGTANISLIVDENNIIDGMSVQSVNAESKFNRVVISFAGGDRNQMDEVFWPDPNSALEAQYLAEDNGRINELRLDYQHITSRSVALQKAKVALAKSRFRSKSITFTGDANLQQVNVNDIINVKYGPLGINGNFRILTSQLNADYTFTITAEEHNANVYGAPEFVQPPKEISANVAVNSLPIYIKNSDPTVVFVGELESAAVQSDSMDDLLSQQAEGWEDYIRTNYQVSDVVFTKEELEEGLEDGTITVFSNTDISSDTRYAIPKPEILNTKIIQNIDTDAGKGDIEITFKPNNNANITETRVLIYDWKIQSYKTIFSPEDDTAATSGKITIKNYDLGIPIKYKLQFKGSNLKINSDEINLDLETYYTENRIITEFFDNPLSTLAKPNIKWNYIDETSSGLTWDTADTWQSADNNNEHNTITYISPILTDFARQELWPETVVLYDSLNDDPEDTRPNLEITYLISELGQKFYEIPHTLFPPSRYDNIIFYAPQSEHFDNPDFDPQVIPVRGDFKGEPLYFIASEQSASNKGFSGAPVYYRTKVKLRKGKLYGVYTRWHNTRVTKTLENYNMFNPLNIGAPQNFVASGFGFPWRILFAETTSPTLLNQYFDNRGTNYQVGDRLILNPDPTDPDYSINPNAPDITRPSPTILKVKSVSSTGVINGIIVEEPGGYADRYTGTFDLLNENSEMTGSGARFIVVEDMYKPVPINELRLRDVNQGFLQVGVTELFNDSEIYGQTGAGNTSDYISKANIADVGSFVQTSIFVGRGPEIIPNTETGLNKITTIEARTTTQSVTDFAAGTSVIGADLPKITGTIVNRVDSPSNAGTIYFLYSPPSIVGSLGFLLHTQSKVKPFENNNKFTLIEYRNEDNDIVTMLPATYQDEFTIKFTTVPSANLISGGTGYTQDDILTLDTGFGTATFRASVVVSAGKIALLQVVNPGVFSEITTATFSLTGGTGTGAEFSTNDAYVLLEKGAEVIISDSTAPIYQGPLYMDWTLTGIPKLIFNEELGIVKADDET